LIAACHYTLENCRHSGWCEHRYEMRRMIREGMDLIASRRETETLLQLVSAKPNATKLKAQRLMLESGRET